MRTHDAAAWSRNAVWWHVFPLGFLDAPTGGDPDAAPVHRLQVLTGWLDHLVGLGANGLALGPVFASHTHGYDTVDHLRIDPRLGTEDDLVALIEACHARGVRVQLDGVFNHVGRGFARFADVLREGPGHPAAGWFRIGGEPRDGDPFGYADFEGHHDLVALNHAEPAVAAYVGDVLRHWCDRGVDAWRLDVAYAVPADFWAPVVGGLREAHPDVWVYGEMIHGDYADYVRRSGLDSVTQYELWKALGSSVEDRNLFELAHALKRHDALLESFLPLTFAGNHDVTRIASRITDDRHLGHVIAAWLMTPGVPSVYYGDELGMTGVKEDRAGGDDAVRPAFPDDPGHARDDGGHYALYRELIAVRRRNGWLAGARVHEPPLLANEAMAIDVRAPGHRLVTVLNLGEDAATASIRAGADAGGTELLAGAGTVAGDDLTVPGHAWAVFGAADQ